jgi:transcription elongation factor Elf1
MCPATQKIPASKMKILTKDAKQMVTGPYYCPQCKKELLQILASSKTKQVYAVCRCGLEEQLVFAPVFQPVDYYNKFRDSAKKRTLSDWERINAEKAKKAEQKS